MWRSVGIVALQALLRGFAASETPVRSLISSSFLGFPCCVLKYYLLQQTPTFFCHVLFFGIPGCYIISLGCFRPGDHAYAFFLYRILLELRGLASKFRFSMYMMGFWYLLFSGFSCSLVSLVTHDTMSLFPVVFQAL